MPRYEYIRLAIDVGDLSELNGLSSVGFRVVAVIDEWELGGLTDFERIHYALLEREIPS